MSTTYILWFLLIGMTAGLLASRVTRGRGLGLAGSLPVGLTGALAGGAVASALKTPFWGDPSFWGVTPGAILFATLGACVTLGTTAWLIHLDQE